MTIPEKSSQARYPWRAVARTGFALLPLIAVLVPEVVDTLGLSQTSAGAVATAASLGITRVLALPSVNAFLQASGILSWLAAEPKTQD